jgi:hypothetical protein
MEPFMSDTQIGGHNGPPPERRAFEAWAIQKHPCVFDARGRASSVKSGKSIGKMRDAAIVNATRTYHRIPVGRVMTEAEYNEAIAATAALEVTRGTR